MPNTGKPSKDCHFCRQRRVKCDLGRPSCQKCVKYGVECPGYRDQRDLVWRNAIPGKIGVTKRKKSPASLKVRASSSETTGSSRSPSPAESSSTYKSSESCERDLQLQIHSRGSTPLFLDIKENWTLHSIPLVLSCYSTVDFLPDLYRKIPPAPDDCLTLVSNLFARAYLATHFKVPGSQGEIALCLGKTLKAIASAIQDPIKSLDDSTIITIWLMGNYEIVVGGIDSHRTPSTPWHVHAHGLLSLLRARGMAQLSTPAGRQIFWAIFNIIQLHCNMINKECPPESAQWLDYIESTIQPGEDLLLSVARYSISACAMFSRMTPIEKWGGRFEEACFSYAQCLVDSDKAELEMLQWMQSAPSYLVDAGSGYDYFWNTWRGTRLKLQNLVIIMANIAENAPNCPFDRVALDRRRKLCREIIAAAAQDIMDGIPDSLEGIDTEQNANSPAAWFEGMRLVWPLTATYMLPTVPRELRMRAGRVLKKIGTERGIMQALKQYTIRLPDFAMDGIPNDTLDGGLMFGLA